MPDIIIQFGVFNLFIFLLISSLSFVLYSALRDEKSPGFALALFIFIFLLIQNKYAGLTFERYLYNVRGITLIHIIITLVFTSSFIFSIVNNKKKKAFIYFGIIVASLLVTILLLNISSYVNFDIGSIMVGQ